MFFQIKLELTEYSWILLDIARHSQYLEIAKKLLEGRHNQQLDIDISFQRLDIASSQTQLEAIRGQKYPVLVRHSEIQPLSKHSQKPDVDIYIVSSQTQHPIHFFLGQHNRGFLSSYFKTCLIPPNWTEMAALGNVMSSFASREIIFFWSSYRRYLACKCYKSKQTH